VAQESGRDETKPKVVSAVTLELTPADAERLDLARSVGTLSLVLRNQLDKAQASSPGISKDALFRGMQQQVAAPAPQVVKVVEQKVAPRKVVPVSAPAPRENCIEIIRAGTGAVSCF
jgi:pilus assembly protein CpaB